MIRNKLKSIRHQYEMNQKEFAEYLGIAQEHISRWEKQRMQPTIENAFRICRKLNIKLEDLFEYEEEAPEN